MSQLVDSQGLGGAVLLDAWERGRARPPLEKPFALLEAAWAAWDGDSPGDPAALPLGVRDRRLLELRVRTLGPVLELCSDCPSCGETLEMTLDGRELLEKYAASVGEGLQEREVSIGELTVRLRPVTGADLVWSGQAAGAEEAERRFLEACVIDAVRDGERVSPEGLTQEERKALAAALAELDPDAEVLLDLDCPGCGHRFRELFDVAAFVAAEFEIAGWHLMSEVASLARGYGWREADILAMSPQRRRAYLELLTG